jgi:hypothetical protein
MSTKTQAKFRLGRIVATPGALETLGRNNSDGKEYIKRHTSGDWGIVGDEDGLLNDQAVLDGSRILSAYLLPDKSKIWIITDAVIDDRGIREATTILLPDEY